MHDENYTKNVTQWYAENDKDAELMHASVIISGVSHQNPFFPFPSVSTGQQQAELSA
jgi:hypothetical protein